MATPTVASLLQPEGPVEVEFYPDDAAPPATGPGSVDARLTAYINRAVAKVASYPAGSITDTDLAVRLWALYLAFEAAYLVKASRPMIENSQVPVLGSQGFSNQQMQALQQRMEQYRVEFEGLVDLTDTTVMQVQTAPARTRIRW